MRLFTKSFFVFLLVLLSLSQFAPAQTTTDQKAPAAVKVVNINTAVQSELETLPGIGPSLAKKIIEFRTKNGNFKTAADLVAVPGIGDKKYEQLKNMITAK